MSQPILIAHLYLVVRFFVIGFQEIRKELQPTKKTSYEVTKLFLTSAKCFFPTVFIYFAYDVSNRGRKNISPSWCYNRFLSFLSVKHREEVRFLLEIGPVITHQKQA